MMEANRTNALENALRRGLVKTLEREGVISQEQCCRVLQALRRREGRR